MTGKRFGTLARIVRMLPLAALAACTTMVQQPAPVERPAGTAPSVKAPAREPDTTTAKATPYRQGAPLRTAPAAQGSGAYVVQPGENLFRISLNHGLKYQDVAKWNNLPDYNIKAGQTLRLTPPEGGATGAAVAEAPVASAAAGQSGTAVKTYPKALKLPYSADAAKKIASQSEGVNGKTTVSAPKADASGPAVEGKKREASQARATAPASAAASEKPAAADEDSVNWIWPTEGKMLKGYSDSNKGLDIGGRSGQAVLAAGEGKVVYSGNGLRGYGKLIIIKHNKTFLSAYAHNSQLLVKEGQSVKKGQKIAEMGNTDADQVKLHFEIRRFGKPVDPMQYLDKKP
ncbi:peptidoglycan DD-metalloendopeptidase family protein [Paludibacterium paludis]|uniref:Peptidase n=1 Tax=Paludibacterium paludis TaxID=1225769 RepID=A0A918P6G7_9NEIS|nr:peptidoglycan DD-metalloendopeptidase family protein [Paludibacterium paludis]GGY26030.1 peptidase [Paludibacterium paludis]